jgi:hypothetical protein
MEKIPDEAGMSFAINKSNFREAGMSFRISNAFCERTHFESRNVIENKANRLKPASLNW